MQGNIVELLQDINPNNRTAEWFGKYITVLRMQWRPLADPIRVKVNKKLILADQDMSKTEGSFKDTAFIKNTKFIPLGIWPRILNIIIEELLKAPPKCELKAQDPAALSDKKQDIELLRQKHILENDINTIGAKVGDPAEIVGNDKFKGNIEEFQRLGLDPNDPEDILFYEQSGFQRLKYEIAGQNLINSIMKANRFDEDTIRKFVIDILSVLVVCMQTYVDAITGQIKYRYIFPEEAYGIFGDAEDGSDDICKGIQKSTTVREWLGNVGNSFDWDKDWRQLLSAINYYYGNKFTGFRRSGMNYDCWGNNDFCKEGGCSTVSSSNLIDWNQAYLFRVYTGHIEWNTVNATATYLAKKENDEMVPGLIDLNYEMTKEETTEYYKESFYQEQMYSSYFLATGFSTQFIYKFGKVYYQTLEGANDEIAKGTYVFYRYEGKSAAEISEPYIDICNLLFYRMKWIIWHSKPQKEQHFLPELIKLSKGFQREFKQNNPNAALPPMDTVIKQIIQFKNENFVDIRDFPEVDGKTVAIIPTTEGAKGGVDNIAMQFQAIEQRGFALF